MITVRKISFRIVSIILMISCILMLFESAGVAYAISDVELKNTSESSQFNNTIEPEYNLESESSVSQDIINQIITETEKEIFVDVFEDAILEGGYYQTPNNFQMDDNTWIIPCKYKRISSEFGYRVHPIHGNKSFHNGIDLTNSVGTEVYATKSGIVENVGYNESMGNFVLINHGNGFKSIYMHLTKYCVKAKQRVEIGELIGYMGSTGESTGSHLHFGIMKNGQCVNPRDYVYFLDSTN